MLKVVRRKIVKVFQHGKHSDLARLYSFVLGLIISSQLTIGTIGPTGAQEARPDSYTAQSAASHPLLAQGLLPAVTPSTTAPNVPLNTPPIAAYKTTTLRAACTGGLVTVKIRGDGVSTSSIRMILHNTTDTPLRIVIPANETMSPNNKLTALCSD